jgi:hypothetical protein
MIDYTPARIRMRVRRFRQHQPMRADSPLSPADGEDGGTRRLTVPPSRRPDVAGGEGVVASCETVAVKRRDCVLHGIYTRKLDLKLN